MMTFSTIIVLAMLAAGCGKSLAANEPPPGNIRKLAPVEGSRIAWDHSSLRKVSAAYPAQYCGYARMTVLPDNTLYCVYEASGNIIGVKSRDNGSSWSEPVVIAERSNGVNMAVPDLLVLQNDALLVCYNPRPYEIDPSRRFAIHTKISYDGGTSFTDHRVLYEAGYQFENGCWEPAAIQLPTGEIQLYFANEGLYTASDEQNISMLRSIDNGKSWSPTPQILSFRQGRRDGMPVPILNRKQNRIFFAIEDNAVKTFKPYIIRSQPGNTWNGVIDGNSPDRCYALQERIDEDIYAGAPYLDQLPSGELLLSYQGTENRTNELKFADMKVVIGSEQCNDFNRKSVPFLVPPHASCLWNSLRVINDSTVIALASTNAYSNGPSEVWMIKGYVLSEQHSSFYIGHKSATAARVSVSYDDNGLNIFADVKDLFVDEGDAISVSLDPANHAYEKPHKGIYSIKANANGQMNVKEGNAGKWVDHPPGGVTQVTNKTADGYKISIRIPWTFMGGKPPLEQRIGFNLSLFENDGKGNRYQESLGSNDPEKPFTWSTIKLK